MAKSFIQKLSDSIQRNNSFLCLGLDPEIRRIPVEKGKTDMERLKYWCIELIDKTKNLVCSVKPNLAFLSNMESMA